MKYFYGILFLVCVIFISCNMSKKTSFLDFSKEDIESISIVALPSPPKETTIKDKEEIKKIIEFFKDVKLKKAEDQSIKGWQFSISLNTKDSKENILLLSNKLYFKDVWYESSQNLSEDFSQIFNNIK